MTDLKTEDIEGEETYVTDIKLEDTEGEEEEIPTDISTDWPSKGDTQERCPRPLYSQHCTEESHRTPQEDQDKDLSKIKVEDIEGEEETFLIDMDGEEIYVTKIKEEDIEGEEETYVTDMKAEAIDGEEETYVRASHQCKEEEIPTDISTERRGYCRVISLASLAREKCTTLNKPPADLHPGETAWDRGESVVGPVSSILGMSREKRPRIPPSSYSSEESFGSGEESDPTEEEDMASQHRTTTDRGYQRQKSKRKTGQPTSRPEEPSEEEASADESGRKNPRRPRYSEAANCALVEGVDRSYEILYGLRSQTTATKEKRKIWDAIAEKVTAVSGSRRNYRNCMKRYSDCRRQTKKKLGMQQRHEMGTGEGPEPNIRWLPWEEMIKRRMNPITVQETSRSVDSHRAAIPEEEEPRRTKNTAGTQKSGTKRKRVEDLPAQRTSSTCEKVSTRNKQHVTQELLAPDTEETMTLLESSGGMDDTFVGFEASHSERTLIKSRRLSAEELRPGDAPHEEEEMPQSSTGVSTGIGTYFRPDLLQEESDEEDVDALPAVSTPQASQMRLVRDIQQGQDPSRVQTVQKLAAEMQQRQNSFRDVLNTRLENIEKTMKRTADSVAEIAKIRQEVQRPNTEIFHILTTSVNKLVDIKARETDILRSMSESHRQIAESSILIANSLKHISECLQRTLTGQSGTQPQPPPAAQTLYGLAPPGPWYGQYPGMYPTVQQHPTSAITPVLAEGSAPRPPRRHQAPPSTSPSQDTSEEEEDQDTGD